MVFVPQVVGSLTSTQKYIMIFENSSRQWCRSRKELMLKNQYILATIRADTADKGGPGKTISWKQI